MMLIIGNKMVKGEYYQKKKMVKGEKHEGE